MVFTFPTGYSQGRFGLHFGSIFERFSWPPVGPQAGYAKFGPTPWGHFLFWVPGSNFLPRRVAGTPHRPNVPGTAQPHTAYYPYLHCMLKPAMAAPIWTCPLCGYDVQFDPCLDGPPIWIWYELFMWRWLVVGVPAEGWYPQREWWCLQAHASCVDEWVRP